MEFVLEITAVQYLIKAVRCNVGHLSSPCCKTQCAIMPDHYQRAAKPDRAVLSLCKIALIWPCFGI